MFPQLLAVSPMISFSAPTLGVEGSCVVSHTMFDGKLISSLTLSRHNPEGAGVCPWCVIQARRVKCEACLSRWIKNRRGVWMCWSTTPMLGSRCSLNFDPSSTLLTFPSDLSPHPHSLSLPLSSPFLPSKHPIHHSPCLPGDPEQH